METKHIIWNGEEDFKKGDLECCQDIIKTGGLVAFPTETVYGLGGDGLRGEVAAKIYAAKGRPSDNPLILHIARAEQLAPLVKSVTREAKLLMEKFWPGPLTMILEKSDIVPYETTGGLETVAIRMPSHPCAIEFLKAVDVPIAAPSANLSGRPSPTKAEHVTEDLDGRIDVIIHGGQVGLGIESTIVDLSEDKPVILRPGYITKEMLQEVLPEVEMDKGFIKDSSVKPKAPGMKYRHYAPKADMTIVQGDNGKVIDFINSKLTEYKDGEAGILTTQENEGKYHTDCVLYMGSRKEKTIARELFGALREFDHMGVKIIFAESFAEEPMGEAVMNRLIKAAGHKIIYL